MPVEVSFLHLSPLVLLLVIPIAHGIYGVRKAKLRSPLHFQQGTLGASTWRSALSMCMISLPPFTVWCLLMSSAASLLYLLGAFTALLIVIFASSNILHYIPSPSIYTYPFLRYHSKNLRMLLSSLQLLLSFSLLLLLLHSSSSFLSSLTTLPLFLVIPLVAFSTLFAIGFSGMSNTMSPIFMGALMVLASGLGLFVYFSVEDVSSLQALLPLRFPVLPSLFSFMIGFVLTLYQLTASPSMYQMYFSLSTRHKLRLCFIFYGVFLLVFSAFVYILTSLFIDFLVSHCQLQYSFSSLFQFIRFTLHPHSMLSSMVAASFVLIPLSVFQSLLISTTSHIWEEYARMRFVECMPGRQLAVLQVIAFLLIILLTLSAVLLDHIPVSPAVVLPIAFYLISALACLLASAFLVGHYLPFTNSKGALTAIGASVGTYVILVALYVTRNDLPELKNGCEVVANATETEPIHLFARVGFVLGGLPLYTHPIILVAVYFLVCCGVSWATGGEDLFGLDWNLVVYVCSPFALSPPGKRRSFVESESFRYAQQKIAYPERILFS